MFARLFRRQQAPEEYRLLGKVITSEEFQRLKAGIYQFCERLDELTRRLEAARPDSSTALADVHASED